MSKAKGVRSQDQDQPFFRPRPQILPSSCPRGRGQSSRTQSPRVDSCGPDWTGRWREHWATAPATGTAAECWSHSRMLPPSSVRQPFSVATVVAAIGSIAAAAGIDPLYSPSGIVRQPFSRRVPASYRCGNFLELDHSPFESYRSISSSSSFYFPNNRTVCTSTWIQFRKAGQQGPTRTLTAALKRVINSYWVHILSHK